MYELMNYFTPKVSQNLMRTEEVIHGVSCQDRFHTIRNHSLMLENLLVSYDITISYILFCYQATGYQYILHTGYCDLKNKNIKKAGQFLLHFSFG